jgi:hypothetical protein
MADTNAVLKSGASGAAAGSAAGPYGALIGGAAGVAAGLIGSGQGEKTIDLAALYNTIQNAWQYQQQIINSLPTQVQANLKQSAASLNTAGAAYQQGMQAQGQSYLDATKGLYGPDSAAATAENAANKEQIYSTVPGSQNAIRAAMAATGGLSRGNAGAALAQPYVDAASQYSKAAAGVNAQQTQAGQQATQQALQVVNTMDTTVFQQMFGMSKEQAQTILTSGNEALQKQLSDLLVQSTNQTNQTLSVQGIQAQNGYQNALQQAGNQNAVYTGLADMGINAASGWKPSATTQSANMGA